MKILAFFFALLTTAAMAQEYAPIAGVDYLAVDPPQSVRVSRGKLELLEFFNFSCPHCYRLQKSLHRWLKHNGEDVSLVRQPVIFQRTRGHYARAYYTLEALGVTEKLHGEMFAAIHEEKRLLNSEGRFVDWLEEQGIDGERAEAVYHSFTVDAKVSRAADIAAAYQVDSTPQLALDGKYLLSPGLSRTRARLFETLDTLIARERPGQ